MEQISENSDVDRWIAHSHDEPVFFFKHSTRCNVSAEAYEECKQFSKKHPTIPCVWIDVIVSRDTSNHLAEISGIVHKSPQVILYENGEPKWDTSHFNITSEALETKL